MSSPRKVTGVRQLAVALLTKSEQSAQYIDHLLEKNVPKSIDSKDRGLLVEIVNGVLRHRSFLDLIGAHFVQRGYAALPVVLRNTLRTAFYQLVFLTRIPAYAAVSEAVEIAKAVSVPAQVRLVNAVLRSYLRSPYQPSTPAADDFPALAQFYSHPLWLIERFVRQFPTEALVPWLQANNSIPRVYLRTLVAENTPLPPLSLSETGVANYFALAPDVDLESISGWNEGRFIVQDPSAGLATELLAAQPNERVIDFCAAPGGKAIALAKRVEPHGIVDAVEIAPVRVRRIEENLQRTRTTNVKIIVGDARSVALLPADAVLVDAPCSGLGVLARRADLRWQRSPTDFTQLVNLQKAILAHAATLVKPGGRLVYSTCSIDREENEQVVEDFLASNPAFRLEPAEDFVDSQFCTPAGHMRTWPQHHGIDGAFAARIRRISREYQPS